MRQHLVHDSKTAEQLYQRALDEGYEGVVSRSPTAYYKYGRRRSSERDLARHREKARGDFTVVSIRQGKRRKEGVEVPVLLDGTRHRSFQQDDYELDDIAGSVRVSDARGKEFSCGFGPSWTHAKRRYLLQSASKFIGKIAEVEFNPAGLRTYPDNPS